MTRRDLCLALTVPPPADRDGPTFAEPWQAQAFAMTLRLHEQGYFSWAEWAEMLAGEIAAAQRRGDPDDGSTYYDHWLAALERIVAAKGLAAAAELAAHSDAWAAAHAATPHGQPVRLPTADD